jgi:hypothetical protein
MIKRIGMSKKNTNQGFGNMFCRTQEKAKEIIKLARESKRWKGILDYNQDVEVRIDEITEEQYEHDWIEKFTDKVELELFNSFIEGLNKVYKRNYEGYPDVGHDGEVTIYENKDFTRYSNGRLLYDKAICSLGEEIEDLIGKKIRVTIEVIE